MDGYEELANAIIVRAAKDYRRILILAKENKLDWRYRAQFKYLRDFFSSNWFKILTNISGDYIMKKIEEEVEHDGQGIFIPSSILGYANTVKIRTSTIIK